MSHTKITYSSVEGCCNDMHNLAMNINKSLNNIKSISNRINTAWKGPASEYYIQRLNELADNFDDTYKELENCILFMAKCSEGYQVIDKGVMIEICNN